MKKFIIPCENAQELAVRIAERADAELGSYEERRFPDQEIYFRIDSDKIAHSFNLSFVSFPLFCFPELELT